jgi:hypothetical protein
MLHAVGASHRCTGFCEEQVVVSQYHPSLTTMVLVKYEMNIQVTNLTADYKDSREGSPGREFYSGT